jgi:methylisocitrate lyase
MLEGPDIVVLPGAYDALSARLAERAGFSAMFTTGFGFSASALGQPDCGLLTMSETMDRVRHIIAAVNVPVVADMDTGYGNPLNVARTVRECVQAGAGGIILEDQQWPKKCGHFEGKKVIPAEEHAAKLRAAIDARAPLGLDEAIRRGRMYRDAGADVVFVEAPQSADELRAVKAAIPDAPLFANMVEGGKTPLLSYRELQDLGYKMVVFPLSALLAATKAIEAVYRELFEQKTTAGLIDRLTPFHQFEEIVGVPELRALEERYGVE